MHYNSPSTVCYFTEYILFHNCRDELTILYSLTVVDLRNIMHYLVFILFIYMLLYAYIFYSSQLAYIQRAVINFILLYYFTSVLFLCVILCLYAPLGLNMCWQASNTIPHILLKE